MGVQDYDPTPGNNSAVNGINILGSAPASNFDDALRQVMADIAAGIIAGSFTANGYVARATGYTVVAADRGKIIDCTTALTLSLTAAAALEAGFVFIVKASGGAVTVDPNGTENINGASASLVIADGSFALIACTGTAWHALVSGNVTKAGVETLTNKTLTTPTLTLKQSAAPAPTDEGDVQWDTDDNVLAIGDGAATKLFVPIPAATAAGDIEYFTGAKVKARLAKGTAAQVLQMKADATAPEWKDLPATPTPDYGAGNAALAVWGVGTYVIARRTATGSLVAGATIAGSSLVTQVTTGTGDTGSTAGAVPSGTWRNMLGTVNQQEVSLYLRIS